MISVRKARRPSSFRRCWWSRQSRRASSSNSSASAQVSAIQPRENDDFDQKVTMTSSTTPTLVAPTVRRNSSAGEMYLGL